MVEDKNGHYLKDICRLYKLRNSSGGIYTSIDESLFAHINGEKIWIIGSKNNETFKIIIDVFKSEEDMKTFIHNHIRENNKLKTKTTKIYNSVDVDNSILHLREAEFRYNLSKLGDDKKEKKN